MVPMFSVVCVQKGYMVTLSTFATKYKSNLCYILTRNLGQLVYQCDKILQNLI